MTDSRDVAPEWVRAFETDLAADKKVEAGLLFKEICVVAFVVVLAVLREVLL